MSKCYVHPEGTEVRSATNRSVCLKLYRNKDEKELSISFDNSLGALPKLSRIQACIFETPSAIVSDQTIYISNSEDLAAIIFGFVNGVNYSIYKEEYDV